MSFKLTRCPYSGGERDHGNQSINDFNQIPILRSEREIDKPRRLVEHRRTAYSNSRRQEAEEVSGGPGAVCLVRDQRTYDTDKNPEGNLRCERN
ncbi:hypothetical protein GWI33_005644 [Rhynchophorus ferrugineus]|uniref:Uncharacterized protein n=1 Tax=Rhynchophorus ferrugineus TaxID=354439 RepID=A0A834MEB0_RHYFE|nr:hypothetical protein GWI33_005644 [Rhynchophorus ferrugineus]